MPPANLRHLADSINNDDNAENQYCLKLKNYIETRTIAPYLNRFIAQKHIQLLFIKYIKILLTLIALSNCIY